MRAGRLRWAVAAVLAGLLLPRSSQAVKPLSRFGAARPVRIEDFRPHPIDGEGYHEEWSVSIYMQDESYLGVDFVVSNVGFGDRKGAVRAKYRSPSQQETRCIAEYDEGEWSYRKSGGFRLFYGENRLEGDLEGLRAVVRCRRLSFDLKLVNEVSPLKPGSGVLHFGDGDGQYSMVFPSPRSRVAGTVEVEGKTRTIDGTGHVSHSRTTMYPHKQFRRWFRFKRISRQVSIILAEFETESPYGHARRGWALVLDPKGRMLATARVNFRFEGFIKDDRSEEGYAIPRQVRFVAAEGESQVRGTLRMTGLKSKSDPTSDLSPAMRTFIRHFTRPADYRIRCDYAIDVKTAGDERRFQGKGDYQFMYVNP
ncbi:MAG: hypothetical protein JXR96_02500 [Deltaproteobacteria bacterium]|nr:hypothetical protein [Deltaproteobacteria bacterium]